MLSEGGPEVLPPWIKLKQFKNGEIEEESCSKTFSVKELKFPELADGGFKSNTFTKQKYGLKYSPKQDKVVQDDYAKRDNRNRVISPVKLLRDINSRHNKVRDKQDDANAAQTWMQRSKTSFELTKYSREQLNSKQNRKSPERHAYSPERQAYSPGRHAYNLERHDYKSQRTHTVMSSRNVQCCAMCALSDRDIDYLSYLKAQNSRATSASSAQKQVRFEDQIVTGRPVICIPTMKPYETDETGDETSSEKSSTSHTKTDSLGSASDKVIKGKRLPLGLHHRRSYTAPKQSQPVSRWFSDSSQPKGYGERGPIQRPYTKTESVNDRFLDTGTLRVSIIPKNQLIFPMSRNETYSLHSRMKTMISGRY